MEASIKSDPTTLTEVNIQLIYILKNIFSVGFNLKMFIREKLSKIYRQERVKIASKSV